jgi:hypothetical protein
MSAMYKASGGSQSIPPESQEVYRFKFLWLFFWLFVLAYLGILAYFLWQDDTVKLYSYHSLAGVFQHTARISGGMGLAMEKRYNDYVELLH